MTDGAVNAGLYVRLVLKSDSVRHPGNAIPFYGLLAIPRLDYLLDLGAVLPYHLVAHHALLNRRQTGLRRGCRHPVAKHTVQLS